MLNKKPASRQALENLKRIPVDTDAPQQRWSTRRRILATVAACALTLSMLPAAGLAAAGSTGTNFDQPEVNEPTTTEAAPSADKPSAGDADQVDKVNKPSESNSSSEKNNESSASKESDQTSSDSSKQPAMPETNENGSAATSTPKSDTKDTEKAASTPESIVDEKTPLTDNALADSASTPIPETKVFTDAGPFLPSVDVRAVASLNNRARTAAAVTKTPFAGSATGAKPDNGLNISKTVTANDDGTYTISMEAYTTGEVTTETKKIPVDIVLVIDQSGSMGEAMSGAWWDNGDSRQKVMKAAVSGFIDQIAEKYDASTSDHRMAIVTFGSNAENLTGWTDVDKKVGAVSLKSSIDSLPDSPDGATQVDLGLKNAMELLAEDSYDGPNAQRQRVVVVFTDGSPTDHRAYNNKVANDAIANSKSIKDAGATVYSIGIMQGANPDQLCSKREYGEEREENRPYTVKENEQVKLGDSWQDLEQGYKIYKIPFGADTVLVRSCTPHNCKGNDPINCQNNEIDETAKINRFMNFVSSNFKDAENQDIANGKPVQTGEGYYLTAANSKDLNSVFASISQNIQTPTIDLGVEAIVQDAVSSYFDLPTDKSEIQVYTAAYNGDGTFADRKDAGLEPVIDKGVVSVSGFDFNANFVSDEDKSNGNRDFGKKLIIEFTVKPKSGFAGGNDVPTNIPATSGVFDKDGKEIERFAADDNTTPKVNVPISQDALIPLFDVRPRDFYKGQEPFSASELYQLNAVSEEDSWKYDFVETAFTVTENGSTAPLGDKLNPDKTTDYTVTATLKPKGSNTGAGSAGAANPAAGKSSSKNVRVTYKTCSLTINKQLSGASPAEGDNFVFEVKGTSGSSKDVSQTIVINGVGSKTIKGLPIGSYTVTEQGGWSWRYKASGSGSVELSPNKPSDEVTITNIKTNQRWISSEASCNNIFVGQEIVAQVSDIAVQAAEQVVGE